MLNFVAISSLIVSIISIYFSINIFYYAIKNKKYYGYHLALLFFITAWWMFFYYLWLNASAYAVSLTLLKLTMLGAIFTYPPLLHFVYVFINKKKNLLLYLVYSSAIIFAYFDLFSNKFIGQLNEKLFFPLWPDQGGLPFVFYTLIWMFIVSYSFILLYNFYKKSLSLTKAQTKLIIWGLLISYISGGVNLLLWYNIPVPPVLNIFISVYVFLFFYAIVRYRFMDIKILLSQILSILFLGVSFSQLFLIESQNITLKLVTFILTLLISAFLILSVNSESKRLRQIEKLNVDLNKASKEITEKNKFLEELLNMKTEFLRVVNHQLNTPLSIMRSAFAMVEEKAITPEKGFGYAKNGLERVSETISDFWEAYELEGVKMKMNKSKTDIEKIVNALIEEKKKLPAVAERKLEIKVEAPKFKIPEVYCDSQKIVHVVSNLLDNAVFYTEKGFITVSYEKSPKVLKVKITDTGMGIAPKNKEKLFQKFSRGQGAVTMKPDGSGLGLFIARKIIEGNDGQIGIESKGEGKGSTFYFTIPIFTKQSSQQL